MMWEGLWHLIININHKVEEKTCPQSGLNCVVPLPWLCSPFRKFFPSFNPTPLSHWTQPRESVRPPWFPCPKTHCVSTDINVFKVVTAREKQTGWADGLCGRKPSFKTQIAGGNLADVVKIWRAKHEVTGFQFQLNNVEVALARKGFIFHLLDYLEGLEGMMTLMPSVFTGTIWTILHLGSHMTPCPCQVDYSHGKSTLFNPNIHEKRLKLN